MAARPRRRSICRALVALGLLLTSAPAGAQGTLEFTDPPQGSSAPLNQYWPLRLEWRADDHPVRDQPVTVATSLGELEAETLHTDGNGRVTFAIRSRDSGVASIRATGGREQANLNLYFDASYASDGPDNPFGDRARARRTGQGQDVDLFIDRIAILVDDGFRVSTIQEFLDEHGVIDLRRRGRNLLLLQLPRRVDDLQKLRLLARELLQPSRTGVRRPVHLRSAGLVAKYRRADQWLLIPDEIIVVFVNPPGEDVRSKLEDDFNLTQLRQLGRSVRRFVASSNPRRDDDPLALAAAISAVDVVDFAEPNFAQSRELRADPWSDPGVILQWHHENDGGAALEDADADSISAWHITYGHPDTIIAVIDSGFDIGHPDLKENLWTGSDGARGIDLVDGNAQSLLLAPTGPEAYAHGTRAAGVAAARGGNTIGYAGACPRCTLLPIRVNSAQNQQLILAFDAAVTAGAGVISNSWGGFGLPKSVTDAIDNAVADGATVLMAMSNTDEDNCGTLPDSSALPSVIAVSGITDEDKRSMYSGEARGWGVCMDVLAPTRGGHKGIHTTSVQLHPDTGQPMSTYWHDFSGTSSSTPLVAGVAGLLKTLDAGLTPVQVQRVLQDTADRIEQYHAHYFPETGFSGDGGESTHGYGRINAFEATRLIAPATVGSGSDAMGRGGHDLLLRDHRLDWGNTEQPSHIILDSPRYEIPLQPSVDIKLIVGPFSGSVTTAADFVALNGMQAEPGKPSQVFVRLRNRGPAPVASASLKLHAAIVGDSYPPLPGDFWSAFPADSADTTEWRPFPAETVTNIEYSGSSVAGCPGRAVPECLPLSGTVEDPARIVHFALPAMKWDAEQGDRLVLLAVVDAEEDPLQARLASPLGVDFKDVHTAVTHDNNIALWLPEGTDFGPEPVPPPCEQWLVYLIIALLAFAVVLLLVILWLLLSGNTVPPALTATLLLTLVTLLVIYWLRPDCVHAALAALGL